MFLKALLIRSFYILTAKCRKVHKAHKLYTKLMNKIIKIMSRGVRVTVLWGHEQYAFRNQQRGGKKSFLQQKVRPWNLLSEKLETLIAAFSHIVQRRPARGLCSASAGTACRLMWRSLYRVQQRLLCQPSLALPCMLRLAAIDFIVHNYVGSKSLFIRFLLGYPCTWLPYFFCVCLRGDAYE